MKRWRWMHLQVRLFQSVLARNSHQSRNENVGSNPKHRMQTCISILQSVLASDQGSMLSRVDGCRLMPPEALDYAPMRTEESRVKSSCIFVCIGIMKIWGSTLRTQVQKPSIRARYVLDIRGKTSTWSVRESDLYFYIPQQANRWQDGVDEILSRTLLTTPKL